jgi:cytochrome P450
MINQVNPPGPTPLQLLGSLPGIQRNPLTYLGDSARQFGDLVHFQAGRVSAYFVNHPDGARRVLQENNANYSKQTLQYNALATLTGRGLLTNEGPSWLRNRRLIQPAFSRGRLESIYPLVSGSIQPMLGHWQTAAGTGQPVDLDRDMLRLTLDVVARALFSFDLSKEAYTLTGAVMQALDHIIGRARNPLALPDWFPSGENLRFRRAVNTLDSAIQAMIHQRLALPQMPDDLLTTLLNAHDENGQGLNERQVRDEVITLLIAGHETVASALTWTWYLLALHPEVGAQMEREVSRVLDGRMPQPADLPRLETTRRIFMEALRLYPPAWLITRTAIAEDEILGFHIPAGALIILSPYTLHRHARFWQQPEEFNPDRFSSENQTRFSYIPFGGGPHLCIGNNFAMIEAQLILAISAQRFRFDLRPGSTVEAEPLVTLRPKYGLPMQVKAI